MVHFFDPSLHILTFIPVDLKGELVSRGLELTRGVHRKIVIQRYIRPVLCIYKVSALKEIFP